MVKNSIFNTYNIFLSTLVLVGLVYYLLSIKSQGGYDQSGLFCVLYENNLVIASLMVFAFCLNLVWYFVLEPNNRRKSFWIFVFTSISIILACVIILYLPIFDACSGVMIISGV